MEEVVIVEHRQTRAGASLHTTDDSRNESRDIDLNWSSVAVIFPVGIEHAFDVPVQRPHDADPRKHRRPARRRNQDQRFHGRLPFRGFVLGFGKLGNVGSSILQGDELATAGQWDWFVKGPAPSPVRYQDDAILFFAARYFLPSGNSGGRRRPSGRRLGR
jgi:hypothetical protein